LERNGIRCWLAPEDLKISDRFRIRVDDAIRAYNKLILLLSENSIESPWIEGEVEAALERERKQQVVVLYPVMLDKAAVATTQVWATDLRKNRITIDMSAWKNEEAYQAALDTLVKTLSA
jgi:hypothetical protein